MLEVSSLKLVVKTMFPSELSTIDIALLVAITVLIVLYVTLLLRLRPSAKPTVETSTKKETHIEEETRPKKTETIRTGHQTSRQELPEKPKTPEKIVVSVDNQKERKEPQAQTEIKEEPQEPFKFLEAPKVEEEAFSIEPPELPSTRPAECPHYYGYLKKLPKNVPIPDECLGCLKIVECLHSSPGHE